MLIYSSVTTFKQTDMVPLKDIYLHSFYKCTGFLLQSTDSRQRTYLLSNRYDCECENIAPWFNQINNLFVCCSFHSHPISERKQTTYQWHELKMKKSETERNGISHPWFRIVSVCESKFGNICFGQRGLNLLLHREVHWNWAAILQEHVTYIIRVKE
jgi:hypothetical protein